MQNERPENCGTANSSSWRAFILVSPCRPVLENAPSVDAVSAFAPGTPREEEGEGEGA